MEREKVVDVVVISVLTLLAMGVAWVCFQLIDSQAEASIRQYRFQGGIAGFVVAETVILNAYFTARRESREVQQLRDEAEQLRRKLIRGAPRPPNFEVEVDEYRHVVFARPAAWTPGGGKIFDFESPRHLVREKRASVDRDGASPDVETNDGDLFPARFSVEVEPIAADSQGPEEFYARVLRDFSTLAENAAAPTTERIKIGGAEGAPGVDSLKFITRAYVRVITMFDPVRRKHHFTWEWVKRQEFEDYLASYVQAELRERRLTEPGGGLGGMRARSTRPQDPVEVARLVQAELEHGRLKRASDFLRAPVAGAPGDSATGFGKAPGSSPVDAARQGAGSGTSKTASSAQEAAIGIRRGQAPTASMEVIPVGRMLVVCYHEALKTVFYFDFVDDASDFTASSECFNLVLNSVRFLT